LSDCVADIHVVACLFCYYIMPCVDKSAAAYSRSFCCHRWPLCVSSVSATVWCPNSALDTVVPVDFVVYFLLLYTHAYQQYGSSLDCCCFVLLSLARQNSKV